SARGLAACSPLSLHMCSTLHCRHTSSLLVSLFSRRAHRQADQAKRRVSEPSGVCSPQVTVSWPIAPLQCTSCVRAFVLREATVHFYGCFHWPFSQCFFLLENSRHDS